MHVYPLEEFVPGKSFSYLCILAPLSIMQKFVLQLTFREIFTD